MYYNDQALVTLDEYSLQNHRPSYRPLSRYPMRIVLLTPVVLSQVNNKWRRDTPRSGTPQPDGGAGPAEASEASVRSLLPPEISPSSEGFSPELYLATFHAVGALYYVDLP